MVIELLKLIDAPVKSEDIGLSRDEVINTFIATKDIRDKYIASRLLWDLGLIEEIAARL
jgi:glycerol-1-phosphate dehydrogenase [NAD(P)+]